MQMIDPVAPRHTAVVKAGMVPVTLSNGPPALELTSAPKHKKNPDAGTKVVYKMSRIFIDQADARALSEGEEVRQRHIRDGRRGVRPPVSLVLAPDCGAQ